MHLLPGGGGGSGEWVGPMCANASLVCEMWLAFSFAWAQDDTILKRTECQVLLGAIVNRTYGTHKHLHTSLFLLTIFGPIYYGSP